MAYDVQGALAEGYTHQEIADHLAKKAGYDIAGARKEGYSDEEIAQHLASRPAKAPKPDQFDAVTYDAGTPSVDPTGQIRAPGSVMDRQRPEDLGQGSATRQQRQVAADALGVTVESTPAPELTESQGFRETAPGVRRATDRANVEALAKQTARRTGALPEVAQNIAAGSYGAAGGDLQQAQDIARGTGTADKSNFDFETAKEYRNADQLSRGLVKGYAGLKNQALGVHQFIADTIGAEDYSQAMQKGMAENERTIEGVGDRSGHLERNFEGAIQSIVSNAPGMLAGIATGAESVPLLMMGAQVFGDEYAAGTAKGQDYATATGRAGLFAAAEILGEKFGMGDTIRAMRSLKGLGSLTNKQVADEFAKYMVKSAAKEVPGEQLTTALQFLTDKIPNLGHNPEAGLSDYLQQVADTFTTTVMQSAMLAGGGRGAIAAHKHLTGQGREASQAIDAEAAKDRALNAWATRGITPSTNTPPAMATATPGADVAPGAETLPAVDPNAPIDITPTGAGGRATFDDILRRSAARRAAQGEPEAVTEPAAPAATPIEESNAQASPNLQADPVQAVRDTEPVQPSAQEPAGTDAPATAAPAQSAAGVQAQAVAPNGAGQAEVADQPGVQPPVTQSAVSHQETDSQPQAAPTKAPATGKTSNAQRSNLPPIMRRDDLVGAIMRVTGGNGVAAHMSQTIIGDTANNATKLRGLFTGAGQADLDDLAMLLRESEGFDIKDGNDLAEKIREAAAGNMTYSMERQERDAAENAEAQYRSEVRKKASELGIKIVARKFSDIERDLLRLQEKNLQREVEQLDEEERAAYDALIAEADALGLDASDLLADVPDSASVKQALNLIGEKLVARIDARLKAINAQLDDAAHQDKEGREYDVGIDEETSGAAAQESIQGQEPGGAPAGDQRDAGERSDFSLEGQTNEQAATEHAQQQAEEGLTKDQIDREAAHFTLSQQSQASSRQAPTGGQSGLFTADGRASVAAKVDSPIVADAKKATAKKDQAEQFVTPPKRDLPTVEHDGDTWYIQSIGTEREDGTVLMHLASTTRGRQQANGINPVQMTDWLPRTAASNYNEWVSGQERDAIVRRLQSDATVRQENGKPFKSQLSAEAYQAKYDLADTHAVRKTDGGFELYRLGEANRPSALKALAERQANDPEMQRQEKAFARAKEIGKDAQAAVDAYENGEIEIDEFERRLDAATKQDQSDDLNAMFDDILAEELAKDAKKPAIAKEAKKAKQKKAVADVAIEPGKIGMKLESGQVVLTASGRKTTPFPKVSTGSKQATSKTLAAVDAWLLQNAGFEARARGDSFNALPFEQAARNPKNISQADKDAAEEYLFGQQPAVVPSILKPLNSAKEPKKGDRFKDGSGHEWEVWSSRQGSVEAFPIVNGKMKVSNETGQMWAIDAGAKERFPDRRTDFFPVEKAKKPVTPQLPGGNMERFIKVAADSIQALRKVDVYRVLVESNRAEYRAAIADYIKENRADLRDEVDSVMREAKEEERGAGKAAASAVKNTAASLGEAIDGLGKLFGGSPGKLNSGLTFDEETYAKAKPHFQAAVSHLQQAGQDIREVMRAVVRMVLDKFGQETAKNMQPYVVRFVKDYQDGIDAAAHEAATSPRNDLPEPSQAQKEAGNYKMGRVTIAGLDISIENPEGSTRSGTDPNGKAWSITMQSHYGYIRKTESSDGDHVDVFVKPGTAANYAGRVYVIDQVKANGHFDEHKVMLGWDNWADAEKAYLANYTPGWKGLGGATPMSLDFFKQWLASDTTKPAADSPLFEGSAAERAAVKSFIKPGQAITQGGWIGVVRDKSIPHSRDGHQFDNPENGWWLAMHDIDGKQRRGMNKDQDTRRFFVRDGALFDEDLPGWEPRPLQVFDSLQDAVSALAAERATIENRRAELKPVIDGLSDDAVRELYTRLNLAGDTMPVEDLRELLTHESADEIEAALQAIEQEEAAESLNDISDQAAEPGEQDAPKDERAPRIGDLVTWRSGAYIMVGRLQSIDGDTATVIRTKASVFDKFTPNTSKIRLAKNDHEAAEAMAKVIDAEAARAKDQEYKYQTSIVGISGGLSDLKSVKVTDIDEFMRTGKADAVKTPGSHELYFDRRANVASGWSLMPIGYHNDSMIDLVDFRPGMLPRPGLIVKGNDGAAYVMVERRIGHHDMLSVTQTEPAEAEYAAARDLLVDGKFVVEDNGAFYVARIHGEKSITIDPLSGDELPKAHGMPRLNQFIARDGQLYHARNNYGSWSFAPYSIFDSLDDAIAAKLAERPSESRVYKQITGAYDEGKEKRNAPGSQNSESDRANAKDVYAVGQGALFAESGGSGQAGHGAVPGAQESRRRASGRDGVPNDGTVTRGERGDQPIHHENGKFEPAPDLAGINDGRGSDRAGNPGVSADRGAAKPAHRHAAKPLDLDAKRAAQQRAQDVTVKPGDRDNIDFSLPFLLPGQLDDVAFVETRFLKDDGRGAMMTNGTGTGKTYSGLGVVKRFERQGKTNILIVAPSDKIVGDWVDSGKNLLLDISQLESIHDAGRGIVATTYANFATNTELGKRDWDLIVTDESHYLSSNAQGDSSLSLDRLRALTMHERNRHSFARHVYPVEYEALRAAQDAMRRITDDTMDQDIAARKESLAKAEKTWRELEAKALARYDGTAEKDKARVVMLSATPFAYVKNVDYAEGYLFKYGPEPEDRGYNTPSAHNAFYVQHFGYRMRYNKLTQPDASVNSDLMEIQFNGWLKKEGALSSRMLDVAADYDRKFVTVPDLLGAQIDDGLKFLREAENGIYRPLLDYVNEVFDYHGRMYLLESIKARHVVPIVKEHLALGRKVVLFHDWLKGGAIHPFKFPARPGRVDIVSVKNGNSYDQVSIKWDDLVAKFNASRKDLVELPLDSLGSALDTLTKAFPDALLFNGQVPKKKRRENVAKFNQDGENTPKLMIAQSAAAEGWSAHDTTGKHMRTLINIGMPGRPTQSIQIEGRVYRTGQVTNAAFRYLTTGADYERFVFASRIAERSGTAENLAMGEDARSLKEAFIEAYLDAEENPASDDDGIGGKEKDRAKTKQLTEWDKAKGYYFAQQKRDSRTKSQEGADYFATPEPVGLKMVEFAMQRDGESAMEPSAGHGAIARWFNPRNNITVVEPSMKLAGKLKMAVHEKARLVDREFESLDTAANKFDTIVMNPPFGVGGKTAIEHLDKALKHLNDGGRIVALIPEGPAADKRFDEWLYGEHAEKIKPVFKDDKLELRAGDTVTYAVRGAFGSVSDQTGTVTDYRDGKVYVKQNGVTYATGIQAGQIKQVAATGPKTRQVQNAPHAYLRASYGLPNVTFNRAGTSVKTRIVIIDRVMDKDKAAGMQSRGRVDFDADNINDLFDLIEHAGAPDRIAPVVTPQADAAKPAGQGSAPAAKPGAKTEAAGTFDRGDREIVEHTTQKGKLLRGIVVPAAEMTKDQAKQIDEFTFPKNGGWFIREKHLKPEAKYSLMDDDAPNAIAKSFIDLAKHDDAFQGGRSTAKDFPTILSDITKNSGRWGTWIVQQKSIIFGRNMKRGDTIQTDKDVWIHNTNSDTPHVEILPSSRNINGAVAYQAAFAWAHNNGKRMVPDPSGLTPINYMRRTEAMISSMLRFGTSAHLEPHPAQFAGLLGLDDYTATLKAPGGYDIQLSTEIPQDVQAKLEDLKDRLWKPEDPSLSPAERNAIFESNLNNLAIASAAMVERRSPEVTDFRIGKDGELYEYRLDDTWRAVAENQLAKVASADIAQSTGVGATSLRRATLTLSILEGWSVDANTGAVRYDQFGPFVGESVLAELRRRFVGGAGSAESVSHFVPRSLSDANRRGILYSIAGTVPASHSKTGVDKAIASITKAWKNGPSIVVLDSPADAPFDCHPRARGAFLNDTVYLFRSNLKDGDTAQFVLLHEVVGHYGLAGILGDQLDPLMRQIYKTNKSVRQAADEIMAKRAKVGVPISQELATEEALANLAGTGVKLNLFSRLVAAIRSALRATGFSIKISDAEVAMLLQQSRKYVERGQGGSGKIGEAKYSIIDDAKIKAGLAKRKTGFSDRIRSILAELPGKDLLQQEVFDKFHGINVAEKRNMSNLPFEQSAYVAARFSTGQSSIMHGLLLHGAPRWMNDVRLEKVPGSRGLLEILDPVKEDLDDWLGWMVGRRANRLMKEGKENNFDQAEIDALLDLAKGREQRFKDVADAFADFKGKILDVAERAGIIDGSTRPMWDQLDWIPFYRTMEEDGTIAGPRNKKGFSGQSSGIRKLRGGDSAINDPLENILMNFTHLIDASVKNNVLRLAIEHADDAVEKAAMAMTPELIPLSEVKRALEANGVDPLLISAIPKDALQGLQKMWSVQPPTGKDVVRVMIGGKAKYYHVRDPLLLKALTSFATIQFPGLNALRYLKRLLTTMTTSTPEFIAANYTRDVVAAMITTRHGFHLADSIRGIKKSYMEQGGFEDMLFAGASFAGGHIEGSDPAASAREIRRVLRRKGFAKSDILTALQTAWEKYREVGDAIENANREAIYESTLQKTGSRTRAAYESKDIMDFSLRGSNAIVQLLADVVPFLNSRAQGLYRLGRSEKKRMLIGGAMMMTVSALLLLLNHDDDRYKQLPDYEKDMYWHLFFGQDVKGHVKIPKPFELGAIFGAIPERILSAMLGDITAKKALQRVAWNIVEQIKFNPIPQAVMPAAEVAMNYDTFRSRSIENAHDQRLLPHMRSNSNTSETMRKLAELAPGAFDATGMSPKKLEHLWNGYLGSMGAYTLVLADLLVHKLDGGPVRPEKRLDQYPLIKRFYAEDPARASQFKSDLYDMYREVSAVERSIKDLQKQGDYKQAKEMQQANIDKLRQSGKLSVATDMLRMYQKKIDRITEDRKLSAHEKRIQIDALIERGNKLAAKHAPAIAKEGAF